VAMFSDHTPHRIACLQPSATVMLAALGRLNRVVACTKYCRDVCPEVSEVGPAIIPDSWTANAGAIVAARPDLVIAAVPYQEKAVAEILKSGARFLGLSPKTLTDIYTDMATIAGVVGVTERGEQNAEAMQKEIDAVREKAEELRRPRVFCEEWGNPLIVSQSWVAELVEAAGGKFVGQPGARISPEQIQAADPEVVIAAWCGAGDRVPLGKIVRDRGWEQVSAVREGRVYCIRDEFLNTPAPTLIQGLWALAAVIHPERFPHQPGIRCISGGRLGDE
jgi:iron complex transport system substrate-binding protein